MVEKKSFVFVGKDYLSKKVKIDSIRTNLSEKGISSNNTFIFFSSEIDLSQVVLHLDNMGFGCRLFIFKNAEALDDKIKEKIIGAINYGHDYFIFDYDTALEEFNELLAKDTLLTSITDNSFMYRIGTLKKEYSLFQTFVYNLKRRDLSSCLFIIDQLFKETPKKDQGLLASGILSVVLKNIDESDLNRLKKIDFVFEADRNLKDSTLKAQIILTNLMVKILGFSN